MEQLVENYQIMEASSAQCFRFTPLRPLRPPLPIALPCITTIIVITAIFPTHTPFVQIKSSSYQTPNTKKGHRLGTAEIESALCVSESCAEAAVVGFPHDIKGQGICCYVVLAPGVEENPATVAGLKAQVRATIGAFATPDVVAVIPGLPKTRSGKIMRRILRKVVAGEEGSLGDVSTLADPSVVASIISKVKQLQGR
jgi:hypothetical protein